jgi:hypothetical protein
LKLSREILQDRKLLGRLARAATETIKIFSRELTGEPQGVPGTVVSIQTDSDLSFMRTRGT